MNDVYKKIIDAAEVRMRIGGFRGFSFRDIAADVGLKSASIHYHFPTKGRLAAEVVRFYTMKFSDRLDYELAQQRDPGQAWIRAFRSTITPENHICPCIVLAAGRQDLPEELASEVAKFFALQTDKLQETGFTEADAKKLLASITGALLLVAASNDAAIYDVVTSGMTR